MGVGGCFTGFGGLGFTGAGFSTGAAGLGGVGFGGSGFSSGGGVGKASRAFRGFVTAGARTISTAYEGSEAWVGFTAVKRKPTAAAWTTTVPTSPAAFPGA